MLMPTVTRRLVVRKRSEISRSRLPPRLQRIWTRVPWRSVRLRGISVTSRIFSARAALTTSATIWSGETP